MSQGEKAVGKAFSVRETRLQVWQDQISYRQSNGVETTEMEFYHLLEPKLTLRDPVLKITDGKKIPQTTTGFKLLLTC